MLKENRWSYVVFPIRMDPETPTESWCNCIQIDHQKANFSGSPGITGGEHTKGVVAKITPLIHQSEPVTTRSLKWKNGLKELYVGQVGLICFGPGTGNAHQEKPLTTSGSRVWQGGIFNPSGITRKKIEKDWKLVSCKKRTEPSERELWRFPGC